MIRLFLVGAFALLLSGFLPPVNRDRTVPLGPVAEVDLERYRGLWYEIARYPNFFERNCHAVTAEYRRREDGRIDVINTCREGAVDGRERIANGVARVADGETNAKLKVRFGGPFEGDYWVLDRAEDYSWSLVGEPRGRFLWILAREPELTNTVKEDLLRRLAARGYRTEALSWTPHLSQVEGRARRTFAAEPDLAAEAP